MKTPEFSLRPATIADAPLFYSVIDRTMRQFIIATWGRWDDERVQKESQEHSSSSNAQVIQVKEISVGVFFVDRYPTYIQLQQIYLLPEYQHQGIGTMLIKGLIAESVQLQIPVRLRVLVVNPAKNLYEQLGFIVTEETSEFFFMEKV
jgi:ribosomal protein S18 acetylase RimI-like enzyme